MIVFDTETAIIRPGLQAPPLSCMALSTDQILGYRDAGEAFRDLLQRREPIGGHGVAFDMCVMASEYPKLLPLIFQAYEDDLVEDTIVRQKLVDIANGELRGFYRGPQGPVKIKYELDTLSVRLLNVKLDKSTWRLRYGELRETPIEQWPDGAKRYVLEDVYATGALWQIQEQPDQKQWLADQYRQARSSFWLKLMSCWGIRTDPKAVRDFEMKTRQDYERLSKTLIEAKLLRPSRPFKSGPKKGQIKESSRDTKAAMARMTIAYKGRPPLTEKGLELAAKNLSWEGFVCLDEEACKASGDPIMKAYGELSSTKKVISTDIPLLKSGVFQPIHSHFEELLETGRTSSSPNVQNLPRRGGMRECFVPRPGYCFVDADYSGLELRTFAQVCLSKLGHSRLAEALNAELDPHLIVAANILECSYEEARDRYKAGEEGVDDARQTGKVCNFGLPGGLGPESFVHYAALQYNVHLSVEKARWLKALWLETWPEGREYLNAIGRAVDCDFPRIEQLFSGRVRGGLKYTEAANSFFQGLGADCTKSAGWLVTKACYVDRNSPLFGSRVVNFVHDQFIVESPIELGHECLEELVRLMIAGASPWLPDVPPTVEGLLTMRWSKDAARIVKDDRVVPWTGYVIRFCSDDRLASPEGLCYLSKDLAAEAAQKMALHVCKDKKSGKMAMDVFVAKK